MNTIDLNIFVGFDPKEMPAYQVAEMSLRFNSPLTNVRPIIMRRMMQKELYWREDERGSTEFSLTRFLTPKLANYRGYALFMDCDVIVRTNVSKILQEADLTKAVNCVKHNYTPKTMTKMDNKKQYSYPRKNWSSVMLFNCEHEYTQRLTPEYINTASPSDLHQMIWAEDSIGELSPKWNHLVGYYDDPNPNIVHFTDGGPWHGGKYKQLEFADEWDNYYINLFTREFDKDGQQTRLPS